MKYFVQKQALIVLSIGEGVGVLPRVASANGWSVAVGSPDVLAEVAVADVVAIDAALPDPSRAIRSIRAASSPLCAAPIVLMDQPATVGRPPDVDDVIVDVTDGAEAQALLTRWQPLALTALTRIEAALGEVAVVDMLDRLRRQLRDALDASADEASRRAHRLAGIAGMLGFSELGEAWLAVERGAHGSKEHARIETRRALAAITRRLG